MDRASHGFPGYLSLAKSSCTLLGLAGLTVASPVFYPLANLVKARPVAGLTVAFGPGSDPGQPRPVQAPDARDCFIWFVMQKCKNKRYYNLRSTSKILLQQPRIKTPRMLGDRSYAVAPPALWNNLPNAIRSTTSKTHLFKIAFDL